MSNPVETTALTKRFGRTTAVDRLSISVPPGEVYGFLGPNGAGKTTTLRMLLGLVRPTSGGLRLFGRGPGHLERVGALIEGPAFYPYLSGLDNLRVLADHAGVPRSRVGGVLGVVGLTDRATDRYASYSLGMKQRLGLAAALLKGPELLILDEPANGLDPAGMADMRTIIRKLAADGCTVLLSSHLLAEVRQVCDRVAVLNRGRLVTETTVADLRSGGTLRVVARPADRALRRLTALVGAERIHATSRSDTVSDAREASARPPNHENPPHGRRSEQSDTVSDAREASARPPNHENPPHGRRSEQSDTAVINLDVGAGRAAAVNAALVGAGVEVSELCWQEPDLEQTFFELTGATDVD